MIAVTRLVDCLQATADAIVQGNCHNAEAVSNVLAEVGGTFTASSTCSPEDGGTAVKELPPPYVAPVH